MAGLKTAKLTYFYLMNLNGQLFFDIVLFKIFNINKNKLLAIQKLCKFI